MVSFLQGAMTRDTTRIVSAMKEMGFISRRADPEVFDRVVQYFHDKMRAQMSVEGFSLKDLRFEPEKSLAAACSTCAISTSAWPTCATRFTSPRSGSCSSGRCSCCWASARRSIPR